MPVDFSFSFVGVDGLRADKGRNSFSMRTRSESRGDYRFGRLRAGRLRVRGSGRAEVRCRPGDAILVPAESEVWHEDFAMDMLSIPAGAVTDVAAANGLQGAAEVEFVSAEPVSAGADRMWRRVFDHVHATVTATADSTMFPLLAAEMRRLVAATALSAFADTAMTTTEAGGPAWAGTAVVSRAIEYIHVHADLPITVTDIAGAAGTDPRGLREAFRRHRATTPVRYLRGVRLGRAHRRLCVADPGDLAGAGSRSAAGFIAQVAAQHGYAGARTFTAAYRRAYGESPLQTLTGRTGLGARREPR